MVKQFFETEDIRIVCMVSYDINSKFHIIILQV